MRRRLVTNPEDLSLRVVAAANRNVAPTTDLRAIATTDIRAMSCGSCCGGRRHFCARSSSGGASTAEGVTTDLGRAAVRVPRPIRELSLALAQVAAIAVPVLVAVRLVVHRQWRRFSLLLLAGATGTGLFALLDFRLDLPGGLADEVTNGTWVASTRFPSLTTAAGLAAAAMVGKPWLSRS
jgi:hypothetical protein